MSDQNNSISEIFASFENAIQTENSTLFAQTLNSFLDKFDEEKYNKKRRLWTLHIGGDDTFSPSIRRTEYEQIWRYKENGCFSYENKKKVLIPGEDLFAALNRYESWQEGFSSWSRHTCYSEVRLHIYSMLKGDDELTFDIEIRTGKDCKKKFYEELVERFSSALEKLEAIRKARKTFDGSKYGFNEKTTDYSTWVAKYLPVILAANGITGKDSWYSGINIRSADCGFWNGALLACTPDGIILWVGGDSTDDETKVSYSKWASTQKCIWRSEQANVTAEIDNEKRQVLSKKIHDYVLSLCRDGIIN